MAILRAALRKQRLEVRIFSGAPTNEIGLYGDSGDSDWRQRGRLIRAAPASSLATAAFVAGPGLAAFLDEEVHDCQRTDSINPPRADKPLRREAHHNHE